MPLVLKSPSTSRARSHTALALAALAAAAACSRPGGSEGGRVAARVNGTPILATAIAPKGAAPGSQGAQGAPLVDRQKLDAAIQEELLWQAGRKLDIPDLDKQIEQRLAHMPGARPSEPGKPAPAPPPEMKERVRRRVVIENYLRANGLGDAEVPEEEIRKYYDEHKQELREQETRRVRHILGQVKTDAPQAEADAALAKVKEARKAVATKQLSFEDAAKKYSDCASARNGGDLGDLHRGYMPKAFDEVAFTLPERQLSDVVRTQHGYHVLEVLQAKPARIPDYAEAHDFVAKYLKLGISQRQVADHVATLKSRAKIELYVN